MGSFKVAQNLFCVPAVNNNPANCFYGIDDNV